MLTVPSSSPSESAVTLLTYFAWHPTIPNLLALTTSSGRVILTHIDADYHGLTVRADPITQHSPLEAWVVAFAPPSNASGRCTVYSGGDDSALRYTTYTPSSTSEDEPHPSVVLPGRHHTAGVTAILPLPGAAEDVVLTGSYDDKLRVFRIAPLQETYGAAQGMLLAEMDLGGGVWRLSVLGEGVADEGGEGWAVFVLASCMHAGARVLRIYGDGPWEEETEDVRIEVVARFEEHKSMNYGSDWSRVESRVGGEDGKVVCVSTSFYDKLLCVWTANLPPLLTSM